MVMWRFHSCATLVLMLLAGIATSSLVSNDAQLSQCLASESTCTIAANTVINSTQTINLGKNIVIVGSGNSVIDLQSNHSFLIMGTGFSLTLANLEIKNGFSSSSASCIFASPSSTLVVTDVVLRNMTSGSYGAVYHNGGASQVFGRLTRVTFLNCSNTVLASGSGASALTLIGPALNYTVEDLTFTDCLVDYFPAFVVQRTSTALATPSAVTVAGNVSIIQTSPQSLPTFAVRVIIDSGSNSQPLSILSNTTKPANWLFSGMQLAMGLIRSSSWPILFEAANLVHNASGLPDGYTFTFSSSTQNASTVHLSGSLTLDSAAAVYGIAPSELQIDGDILSTNCLHNYLFFINSPASFVTAANIITRNSQCGLAYVALNATHLFSISATGNLRFSGHPTNSYNILPVIYALIGNISITTGGSFVIEGVVKNATSGGAIGAVGHVTIDAHDSIIIQDNTNPNGTGSTIFVWGSGGVSLKASSIVVQRNSGSGATIRLDTGTTFTLNASNVLISENRAINSSPLSITVSHSTAFSSASFIGNYGVDCIVSFKANMCQRLSTSGAFHGNRMSHEFGNSSCVDNEYFCIDPPISSPSSCVGSAPSSGNWNCESGQWVSSGSVSGGSVTIPASSVVVNGNLTLIGVTTFSGLGSSVMIEGGCAYIDGTVQVELTPSELEAISKESGGSRSVVLISQSSNCTTNFATLSVTSIKSSKSCRKVISSTLDSDDGTHASLVAVFKVDSSSCNTRWIILGCVLGGVLLIALVILLAFTLSPKVRGIIAPYSNRNQPQK